MNKYFLFFLSLVLLVTLGFFYTKPKEQKSIKAETEKAVHVSASNVQKKEVPAIFMHSKSSQKPPLKAKTPSTENHNDSHSHTMLYEPLSPEEAQLSTSPRKNVSPIGALRIMQTMSELQVNDTLTLTDVEGEDYTLTIQSVHENNDGSTSTTANYEDEGITYTTTITQSSKSTYISMSTANGLYEIETSADIGYVYRTDTIRKQLQSRTPNDVIILPIPKTGATE